MRTVVVGGTAGIGLEVARHRVARGDDVVLTGRDAARTSEVAASIGGSARGIALDLQRAATPSRDALREVGPVDRLVLAAIERDANTVADYAHQPGHSARHDQARRLHRGGPRAAGQAWAPTRPSSLFGGLAKDRPYPGSTTVSTVNGGVVGMVNALALELAPIRVNAIHPGIVGDSPFWAGKPAAVLEGYRTRTPTGRLATMADIVDAVDFLLENRRGQRPPASTWTAGGWSHERGPARRRHRHRPDGHGDGRPAGAARATTLTVHNRTRAKAEAVAARHGAAVAPTPREAVREADVVVVSLADDAAVAAAYGGADGLVAGLAAGHGGGRHQHRRPGHRARAGGGRRRRRRRAAGHPGVRQRLDASRPAPCW